jgi:hypothetical protein
VSVFDFAPGLPSPAFLFPAQSLRPHLPHPPPKFTFSRLVPVQAFKEGGGDAGRGWV